VHSAFRGPGEEAEDKAAERYASTTSAVELIAAIHHSAEQHCTWRAVSLIGAHMLNSVAIAVQRSTGWALQTSLQWERRIALGGDEK